MWQVLLQNWIREQVQTQLHEAVSAQADAAAAPAPPPIDADVGIVFALGIEAGGLIDRLDGVLAIESPQGVVRQGGWKGLQVVLIEGGVGRECATRATQHLLEGHKPRWIISAGFAGALRPGLKRNDIVLATGLVEPGGQRCSIDLKMSADEAAKMPGLHLGTLVTVDSLVRTSTEKRALGEQHGALAVDMETWAVAQVCREHKVRFLAVRVISDTVEDELPEDIERLVRQKSLGRQLGAAAAALWQRPASIKDMWQLKEAALVASDRLAKFVLGMVSQLK